MKRSLFFALVIFYFYLTSCQFDKQIYSCDPVINSYVNENKEEFSQLNLQQLTSYDYTLQKAIFNSWDYTKKREAWIDKLNYIISNEKLTYDEIIHIQKLIDHIQPDYFSDESLFKNSEGNTLFANKWIEYSQNELGWSDQFIAFIVYRLYLNQTQLEAELSELNSLRTETSTDGESCNCNRSADFCGDHYLCRVTGCTPTGGCGWLGTQICDGSCLL